MTLGVLIDELSEVTAMWYLFGIQLGVEPSRMEAFQSYSLDVRHKLSGMLQLWLQKDPPPTIQDLLKALRSKTIRNHRLAAKLERTYEGKHKCMYVSVSGLSIWHNYIREQDSYFELCSTCVHNAVLIVHCSYLLWYFNMIKSTMVFQYDSIYSGISA